MLSTRLPLFAAIAILLAAIALMPRPGAPGDLGAMLWLAVALASGLLLGLRLERRPARRGACMPDAIRCGALLDAAPVGLWQLDAEGRTVFANAQLATLCGGAVPAGLAASGLALAGPADPRGLLGLPTGREVEASLPRADGGRRPVSLHAVAFPGDAGGGCVLTLLDIGPLKAAQARLDHLAEHDALTGLTNRAQFHGGLAALAGSPTGGSLLLLEIDRFRAVNDRLGLANGDAVLRLAADRLRACVRPADLVCRVGEDQFAVLIFGDGAGASSAVAARLRESLATPMRIGSAEVGITACVGSALAPADATGPDTLMRAAKVALRAAQQAGRNRYLPFRPELSEARERQARLRDALAEALTGDGLQLAWQPQRDFVTHRLLGAEALLRWHCPKLGGAVSPGELLPVAAAAGLLPAIDAWVLETALRQITAWDGLAGAPPLVSVNISAVGLQDVGFADQVARALLRHGIRASRLEIEIPEDLAVQDLPAVEATLAGLHALGVRLALDDFGSGHSSLPHVVRLPVDRLKLDRSIVSGLPEDAKARAVLHATMALTRDLGIEVIGEGVETRAQAEALHRAGCTLLQGWLIGRPVPAAVLLEGDQRVPHRATA